jgi:Holliday junction resolvasome RuvABC endonuclease subunit
VSWTRLSLDLGTTTGWAVSLPSGQIVSGSRSFKPARFEGGGMRFLRFTAWLDEMNNLYTIGSLTFEEVRRHSSTDAAHVYGGLMATLTAWCEAQHKPYQGVPVGTIKKHVTGKGNANKALVMQAMVDKGHTPCDDNEADALALLYTMLENNP